MLDQRVGDLSNGENENEIEEELDGVDAVVLVLLPASKEASVWTHGEGRGQRAADPITF
jgi:hypothetical protein